MNWGHKITFVIIAFITGMLGMVFLAFRQTNEMVDSNYYEKELKYQDLIDASKNFNIASYDTLISQNKDSLVVKIPTQLLGDFSNGSLEFIRNSDQSRDLLYHFTPNSVGNFFLGKEKFIAGMYMVRIHWNSLGKSFYKEKSIFIN